MILSPVDLEDLKSLYIEQIAVLNRPFVQAEFEEFTKGIGQKFTDALVKDITSYVSFKQAQDLKNRKWQDPTAPIGVEPGYDSGKRITSAPGQGWDSSPSTISAGGGWRS